MFSQKSFHSFTMKAERESISFETSTYKHTFLLKRKRNSKCWDNVDGAMEAS